MDVIEVVCGGLAMAGRVSQGCTWGFPEALKKKLDHPGQELNLGGGQSCRYRVWQAWGEHGGAPARLLTRGHCGWFGGMPYASPPHRSPQTKPTE
jgi:hypothetical protein